MQVSGGRDEEVGMRKIEGIERECSSDQLTRTNIYCGDPVTAVFVAADKHRLRRYELQICLTRFSTRIQSRLLI